MLAFVRNSNYENLLTKLPEPYVLNEDDVKIRMEYCSFCRDDMRINDNFNVFGKIGTIGHEGAGVIFELGKQAKEAGFKIGDRVSMQFIDSCGTCKNCLSQHPHLCPEAKISDGVLSDYTIRKFRQLIKVPDDVSFKQASLIEPVSDVIEAISKLSIDFQSDVLLIGSGFIGLIFIKLLKAKGVKTITVIEPIEYRRKLALEYGADFVFSPAEDNLELKIMEISEFWGYDIAIETSSLPSMIEKLHTYMMAGGTILVFTYSDLQDKICFNSFNIYRKSLSLIWSCLSNVKNMNTAAALIKKFSFEKLITAEYPFSQCQQAYEKYLGTSEIKIGIKMR